ncbi:MAG: ribonuclease Z [Promethearchaeota archaeon]|nr:MAG: ribonuclease Z [Candidatus Lokiarchaeota archaeon]
MLEIIFLGTSAASPIKDRNLSSVAIKYRNHTILFDCGEDVQRRFIEAGLKFNKPLKILISHFHGDHVIGLPGLLFRFSLIERTAPLTIIGPPNLFLYLYLHRKILGLKTNYPIKIIEIDHLNQLIIEHEGLDYEMPSNTRKLETNITLDTKRFFLKYAVVKHSILTYAYAFVEKPRYGKFNPERARELGIPESHLWKKLQAGNIIEFEGKKIDPVKEQIIGPQRSGRMITYSSDTAPCDTLIELGKNSDVLIHEATFSKKLQDIAEEKLHSTSVDAAIDAKRMNAQQLILTHISSRYQEDDKILLQEAKEIFPNTVLARDLLRVKLK